MTVFTKRQQEIIDASVRIIAEGGIQELTIKNLSQIIGISEPALYRHFENKMAILTGILTFFANRSRATFERIAASEMSGREQIEAIFTAHFDQFAERPAISAVIFSEEIFQNDRQLADMVLGIMNAGRGYLHKFIEKGVAEGEFRSDVPPEHLVLVIMGSLRLIVNRWRLLGYAFDLRQEGRTLWKSLRAILAPCPDRHLPSQASSERS